MTYGMIGQEKYTFLPPYQIPHHTQKQNKTRKQIQEKQFSQCLHSSHYSTCLRLIYFSKSDCNYKCQIQIFTYVKTFFPLDDLTDLKLTLESSKKKYNCVYPWIRIQKLIIIIQVLFDLCKMVCFHLVIRGYCYQPLNISLSHLQNNL